MEQFGELRSALHGLRYEAAAQHLASLAPDHLPIGLKYANDLLNASQRAPPTPDAPLSSHSREGLLKDISRHTALEAHTETHALDVMRRLVLDLLDGGAL